MYIATLDKMQIQILFKDKHVYNRSGNYIKIYSFKGYLE